MSQIKKSPVGGGGGDKTWTPGPWTPSLDRVHGPPPWTGSVDPHFLIFFYFSVSFLVFCFLLFVFFYFLFLTEKKNRKLEGKRNKIKAHKAKSQ